MRLTIIVKRTFKRYWKMHILAVAVFYIIMFSLAFILAPSVEAGDIIDPYEDQDIDQMFYQFEGRVFVLSKAKGSDLLLYAETNSRLFRKFQIHMLANQHAFYQIKIDNQTHATGEFDFWAMVEAESAYDTADITVTLKNETGVELPLFQFNNLQLMDTGEEPGPSENGEPSPIIEPYIRMTQGEFSIWIALRLITDLTLTVLGFLTGSSLAVIKSDFGGVERIL